MKALYQKYLQAVELVKQGQYIAAARLFHEILGTVLTWADGFSAQEGDGDLSSADFAAAWEQCQGALASPAREGPWAMFAIAAIRVLGPLVVELVKKRLGE